jgi:hypothetical protein
MAGLQVGTGDHLIKGEACPVASPRVTSRPFGAS